MLLFFGLQDAAGDRQGLAWQSNVGVVDCILGISYLMLEYIEVLVSLLRV